MTATTVALLRRYRTAGKKSRATREAQAPHPSTNRRPSAGTRTDSRLVVSPEGSESPTGHSGGGALKLTVPARIVLAHQQETVLPGRPLPSVGSRRRWAQTSAAETVRQLSHVTRRMTSV